MSITVLYGPDDIGARPRNQHLHRNRSNTLKSVSTNPAAADIVRRLLGLDGIPDSISPGRAREDALLALLGLAARADDDPHFTSLVSEELARLADGDVDDDLRQVAIADLGIVAIEGLGAHEFAVAAFSFDGILTALGVPFCPMADGICVRVGKEEFHLLPMRAAQDDEPDRYVVSDASAVKTLAELRASLGTARKEEDAFMSAPWNVGGLADEHKVVDSSDLDEHVHDAASDIASGVKVENRMYFRDLTDPQKAEIVELQLRNLASWASYKLNQASLYELHGVIFRTAATLDGLLAPKNVGANT
ncbi:MAG: hypothetical protein ACYDAG_02485 [Chloroflexota bacterium]